MRVGGSLSADPHLAARLDAFIRWYQVLPVLRASAEIFRDADALREHRDRARLKHLFLRHGWDSARFLDELHRRLPFPLDPPQPAHAPLSIYRDHVAVH